MKKTERKIHDPTLTVLKKLSLNITSYLEKTRITANQVTIVNFILFVPLASYFFVRGGWIDNFIALGLLACNSFFDLVDGELARRKKQQSRLGHWLDISLDSILQTIIMFSISIHVLLNYDSSWKYLVLLPLFGQALANVLGLRLTYEFKVDPFSGNPELDSLRRKSKSFLDRFMKNMLIPSDLDYLIFFTLRFYMLVGIILNILPITFITFGFFILVRAVAIYLILTIHYSNSKLNSAFSTLRYLNKSK